MKLEELLDLDQFTASIAHLQSSLFRTWSSTAIEICPDRYRDFVRLRDIYLEIPANELSPQQILTFMKDVLAAMPTDSERKSLIRIEALQFRTFERQ